MSASERLKALEARRPAGWQPSMTVSGALIHALPQIVAVTSAAERASRNGARMPVSDPPLLPDEMDDLRAALSALEEALP